MVEPLKLNILPNDRELEISGSLFCLYGKKYPTETIAEPGRPDTMGLSFPPEYSDAAM